jgi:tungstate transport system ATP-binding protein
MATHDQSEALRLSERIAVMKEGKIIQIGTPTQVMNHPADEFVASFVGVETILSGTVKENREGIIVVDIGGHTFEALGELRPGTGVTCCIRPEHITLARFPADSGSSARNALTGKIENIQPMGLFYKIQLDCGFYLVAYITRTSLEELSLKTGDQVIATFKATAVHVIRATA